MKNSLAHRGPDAEGSYFDEGTSLGHRRLSILDLSQNGRQPLSNEDGSVWISFNGEIYNYPELKRILEQKGHVFRSRTDTEAIVHAYEEYGLDCVKHLTGMFAFAIRDLPRKKLILARDRLGIKPLYYYSENGRFLFASEIKAILCDPEVPRRINLQALFHLMGYEYVPGPDTLFQSIYKLMPGTTLVLDDLGHTKVSQYWSLEEREIRPNGEELLSLLEQACKEHALSDVPVGAFLSGGIDSSAILRFLVSAVDYQVKTFTLGYSEKTFSEFEYAKNVARHYDTEHHELLIPPISTEAIERSVWHLDEPVTDLSFIPFMLICQQASQQVKVCLIGSGGDELLMGYDRFRASKAAALLDSIPIPFRRNLYLAVINLLGDTPEKKGVTNVLKRFLQGAINDPRGEHMRWQYFLNWGYAQRLFKPELLEKVNTDPFEPVCKWTRLAPKERGQREQFVELNTFLPDCALVRDDRLSMAYGLEVRPPFLDHRLVEYCYSLPSSMKLHRYTTKWIFKKSAENLLPPGVAFRKKQGFSFPIKNWMRGELLEFTREEIFSSNVIEDHFEPGFVTRMWEEHQSMRHNHSHVLWALLNISLWAKLFLEGSHVSQEICLPSRALSSN